MLNQPKACPFCGSERVVARSLTDYQVECMKCNAQGPRKGYNQPAIGDSLEQHNLAVDLWNERVGDKQVETNIPADIMRPEPDEEHSNEVEQARHEQV